MSIMLVAELRNTLPKNVANRQRLCITKELELFMKLIIQFKGDSFHSQEGLIRQNLDKNSGIDFLHPTLFGKNRIAAKES